MAVSKRAFRTLAELDFQPRCEFPVGKHKWCRNYAVWAMFRVPCECEGMDRVWLACNKHKREMFALEPAQCEDCDTIFEPTGEAAFDKILRLTRE